MIFYQLFWAQVSQLTSLTYYILIKVWLFPLIDLSLHLLTLININSVLHMIMH